MSNIVSCLRGRSCVSICAGALVLVASSCMMFSYKFTASKSTTTTHEGTVRTIAVSTSTGDVSIKEDPTVDRITIQADFTATGADQAEADARLEGVEVVIKRVSEGSISIEPEFPDPNHSNEGADLTILVPSLKGISISVNSGTGDLTLTGAEGSIDLESGTGDITLVAATGDAMLGSGTGDIRVRNHAGGKVKVEAGVGDVFIELAEGADGPIDVEAGIGDISISCPFGFKGGFDVEADMGDIKIDDSGKQVTKRSIQEGQGSIEINSGRTSSSLETGLGSISIKIRGESKAKKKKKGSVAVS